MNKIQDEIIKAETDGQRELSNFVSFAFKGRMVQMSVAFIIGAAFQKTVESISQNILMPFINFFISQTGVNWRLITWTPVNGMVLEIGKFLGSFVDFLLIALVLYILYVKILKPVLDIQPLTKICPNCLNIISVGAKRCSLCTSWLEIKLDE